LQADNYANQAITPQVAYLMNSVLKDVIKLGTGRGVLKAGLKRDDIGGKTGTTNDQKDAWFAGFNSDVVTVVWVGFDQPKSLNEYAAKAALPVWVEFMKTALQDKPEHSMPQPSGIVSVRIDPITGRLANNAQSNSIFEYFTENTVPTKTYQVETNFHHVDDDESHAPVTHAQDDYFGDDDNDDDIRLF
jgi:penicillin-binding protein 1A